VFYYAIEAVKARSKFNEVADTRDSTGISTVQNKAFLT